MADIFDVVADSTRRDLLQLLLERYLSTESPSGEISVGELVVKLGLSQPTVSKHLKVLRDSSLVSVREEGQHRYYRLDSTPLEQIEDWLIPFLSADYEDVDEAGSTVFSAWAGSQLPKPLRRVAESLDNAADAGAAVGRTAATASHQVRNAVEGATHVLEEASATVERKVIDPLKERWSKRRDDD